MQDFDKPRGTEVSTMEMLPTMGLSPSVEKACIESNKDLLLALTSTK